MNHVIGLLIAAAFLVAGWIFVFASEAQIDRTQALLAPSIAFLAVCIAFGQWHIARNKLKLDLFKQRSEVYEATRLVIQTMITAHFLTGVHKRQFLEDTRGVLWLFNPGVRNFVDEVWDVVLDMENIEGEIEQSRSLTGYSAVFADPEAQQTAQAQLNRARARRLQNLHWCNDQISNRRLETLFKEFLEIEH